MVSASVQWQFILTKLLGLSHGLLHFAIFISNKISWRDLTNYYPIYYILVY